MKIQMKKNAKEVYLDVNGTEMNVLKQSNVANYLILVFA